MEKRKTFEVEEDGWTVQQYLRSCAGFSRAQIRGMKFTENGICVNGKRCRATQTLRVGDSLEVCLAAGEGASGHLVSWACMPEILCEDEDLIAVNKPAGIAVHPSHGHYGDTLANQLAFYFRESGQQVQIHSVGRLDLETSGIVLFAKHSVAAARLSAQRESGKLQKEYLALCAGRFLRTEGVIDQPIAPLPGSLMKMCVHSDGKRAVTRYRVEQQYEDRALVRLRLETGRTHQIRVHMAYMGHPLIGDRLYEGSARNPASETEKMQNGHRRDIVRAALHAECLTFFQPFSGERIVLHADLPEDMKNCVVCSV